MRSRGQGSLALIVAAALIAGGFVLERSTPRERPPATGGSARSGSWICPHGGGDGWKATIFLANPSQERATTLVSSMTREGSSAPGLVVVPPGSTVHVDVDATRRESSTFVETFGPWVAAGWVVRGSETERGAGAEPCSSGGARSWYLADGSTEEGEQTFVVIANPYAANAVVDVALFAKGRAPVRDSRISNISIPARGSVSIKTATFAAGEPALGTFVQAKIGRIGVAALGVGASGIRSTLAQTHLEKRVILPSAEGTGESTVEVFAPNEAVAFGTTRRSGEEPQLIEGMSEVELDPQSAAGYPILTEGPSAIDLTVQNDQALAAALRVPGADGDVGSTAGAPSARSAWIVLPATAGDAAASIIVLSNPGTVDADVRIELLSPSGGSPLASTVSVPAGGVASTASEFLEMTPGGAALVVCESGSVVALGAAPSGAAPEPVGFALSVGVPMPA